MSFKINLTKKEEKKRQGKENEKEHGSTQLVDLVKQPMANAVKITAPKQNRTVWKIEKFLSFSYCAIHFQLKQLDLCNSPTQKKQQQREIESQPTKRI